MKISLVFSLLVLFPTFFLINPIFGYENNEYGFSIEAPSGWAVNEDTGIALMVVMFTDPSSGSSINVVVEETIGTLIPYVESSKNSLVTTFEDFILLSEGTRVIGGMTCYELVYTYELQGMNLKGKQIYFIESGKAYLITCTALETQYVNSLIAFENCLATFRINDSPPEEPTYMGEWTSDNRMEMNVHSFNTSPSIDFIPNTPNRLGYIYAWVDVSLKNLGTEAININLLYAHLKDSENYIYQSTVVASPKLVQLMDINPGETIRGELYWEIPEDAIITEFIWQDYRSNLHTIIPEFQPWIILPLILIGTVGLVILRKRMTPNLTSSD